MKAIALLCQALGWLRVLHKSFLSFAARFALYFAYPLSRQAALITGFFLDAIRKNPLEATQFSLQAASANVANKVKDK